MKHISNKQSKQNMDLKKREDEKKEEEIDHGLSLQRYLDTIPLSSMPSIKHSHVLELKAEDSVKEAVRYLFEKNNVCGALIADTANNVRFLDRYIGFVALSGLVFWCLEEYEKERSDVQDKESEEIEHNYVGVFAILDKCPKIGQTKIQELAKSFLWQPFFPVHFGDTLFHAMLLLSKHQLTAVPVIDRSTSRAIGFVTLNAVIQTLLQSSGLEWFDKIADTAISKFRIENEARVVHVYRDQSTDEALQLLRKSKMGVIAVINRESEKLIGSLSNSNVDLLLGSVTLLRKLKVEEFLQLDSHNRGSEIPRPHITNKKTDTLKQVMENLVQRGSGFSFLVDESQRAIGVISFRDIIAQFAPPCIDSSIHGGGFFESALEQTGCCVEKGTLVCEHSNPRNFVVGTNGKN